MLNTIMFRVWVNAWSYLIQHTLASAITLQCCMSHRCLLTLLFSPLDLLSCLLSTVVKGVPSVGVQVMIGSGQIGPQPILPIGFPPPSSILRNYSDSAVGSQANTEYNPGLGNDQAFATVVPTGSANISAGNRPKLGYVVELLRPMWIVFLVNVVFIACS